MNYVFQFGIVWREIDTLLLGAWLTVRLSAIAMVLGLAVGVAGALARGSGSRALRGIARAYVEAIRNTPFLVQVLLVYLGLPSVGIRLRPDTAALLAMVVNLGAYATEIMRAGVKAVPAGQMEAGKALGLSSWQIFRFVVFLPALRAVFPALGSQFILVMLASSVVSVISAEELTAVADTIVTRNFRSFEVYLVVTGLYLVMSLGFQASFAAIHRVLFARWGNG
ncbi:MAG TPA: amino acid ABC transporter permease [Methylomirabilota bacterium]|nr:amino acid ABC transporter permease [Methylomirabilota bacterium]